MSIKNVNEQIQIQTNNYVFVVHEFQVKFSKSWETKRTMVGIWAA